MKKETKDAGRHHVELNGETHLIYSEEGKVILHRYEKKEVLNRYVDTFIGGSCADAFIEGFLACAKIVELQKGDDEDAEDTD